MSRRLRLYPEVKVTGQDFSKEKVVTVPSQSMTLKEILRRFIRREPLAIEHNGFYSDGDHPDLEKVRNEDFVVQDEILSEQVKKVQRIKKQLDEKEKKAPGAKADAKAKAKAGSAARETDPPAAAPGADSGESAGEAD